MISDFISLAISSSSFLYTFHVLYNFMYFTSTHNEHHKIITAPENNLIQSILWRLLTDTSLLSIFVLQHSVMANEFVKKIYQRLNKSELERSIYNVFSSAALHLMIIKWQPIPWVSLWNVDTTTNNTLWLLFTTFHSLGWFIIYSGCVMLDIAELIGIKQVYYKISNRPCPLATKSREYQRYLSHMRHPSFVGFLMIVWVHPFMTIDRFLLASVLTIYMLLMWKIDQEDYNYHAMNVQRKRKNLS
ncbi:nurim homolog [Chelonus insularis]|uniref:nurim homolog n=1 Tax=Chelonus insularis TaxID=460826 RepID=UPI001588A7DB|nr:nurim homolog [Chelonus insularis]